MIHGVGAEAYVARVDAVVSPSASATDTSPPPIPTMGASGGVSHRATALDASVALDANSVAPARSASRENTHRSAPADAGESNLAPTRCVTAPPSPPPTRGTAATTRGAETRAKLDVSRAKKSSASPAVGSVTRIATNALAPGNDVETHRKTNPRRYSSPATRGALAHDASESPAPRRVTATGTPTSATDGETTSTRGCATYVSGAGASDHVASRRVDAKNARSPGAPAGKRHANAAASSSVASAGAAATGPTVPILHAACRHDGAPPPTMETTADAPPRTVTRAGRTARATMVSRYAKDAKDASAAVAVSIVVMVAPSRTATSPRNSPAGDSTKTSAVETKRASTTRAPKRTRRPRCSPRSATTEPPQSDPASGDAARTSAGSATRHSGVVGSSAAAFSGSRYSRDAAEACASPSADAKTSTIPSTCAGATHSTVSESIVRADTGPSVPNRHVATAELKSPETRTVPPWIETSASGSTARTTAESAYVNVTRSASDTEPTRSTGGVSTRTSADETNSNATATSPNEIDRPDVASAHDAATRDPPNREPIVGKTETNAANAGSSDADSSDAGSSEGSSEPNASVANETASPRRPNSPSMPTRTSTRPPARAGDAHSATPGLTNRAGTGETVPIAHARWRELARVGAVRTSSRVPPEVVTTRGVISFTASSARYANASSAADVARKPSVNLAATPPRTDEGDASQRIRAVETMRETPKASPKAQPVEEVAWRTSIRATDPPPA